MKNYIYKATTKTCETQFTTTTTFNTANTAANTTKVSDGLLPGQPCVSASACVVGLVCQNSRCKCPDPCKYVAEQEACDCGPVEVSLAWPIIIGVSVGLVIVAFLNFNLRIRIRHRSPQRAATTHALRHLPRAAPRSHAHPQGPQDLQAVCRAHHAPPACLPVRALVFTSHHHPPPTITAPPYNHHHDLSPHRLPQSPSTPPPPRRPHTSPTPSDPQTPLLYPASAPQQDRKTPNFEGESAPPYEWTDAPRSARF
ncbi:hypothetical protein O3P69_005767 [Scylla paramamosain]|uniref:EB domain-containing protein n=1 Tax=Scylla paramamosain TaxID=85552 RepID=A0AAW0U8F9_SCYPA